MVAQITLKRCSKCKQVNSIEQFHKHLRNKDGLQCWCKHCQKQHNKRYYQAHKVERQQYDKEYYKTIPGYLRNVWRSILRRCNNPKHKQYKDYGGRGIKVKIVNFEDFYNYVVNELKVNPRGLTIDRIDNNRHYERGNIRFVTQAENNLNR